MYNVQEKYYEIFKKRSNDLKIWSPKEKRKSFKFFFDFVSAKRVALIRQFPNLKNHKNLPDKTEKKYKNHNKTIKSNNYNSFIQEKKLELNFPAKLFHHRKTMFVSFRNII